MRENYFWDNVGAHGLGLMHHLTGLHLKRPFTVAIFHEN
jgi:hypothetical protein